MELYFAIFLYRTTFFKDILVVKGRFHADLLFKGIIKTLSRSKTGFNGNSLHFIILIIDVIH